MIKVYGIKNCSTVKKALSWLENKDLIYEFHDYKKLGANQNNLQKWCNKWGWEVVLNKKGMMWKKTDEKTKNQVIDQKSAINFMLQVPNGIKRPVIEINNEPKLIGFEISNYEEICL